MNSGPVAEILPTIGTPHTNSIQRLENKQVIDTDREIVDTNENETISNKIRKSIATFAVFVGFVGLSPLFAFLYFAINVCRYLWLRGLSWMAPHLEIIKNTTIRTAMDTHRYQAIIPILLQVKGRCNLELIKQHIKETVIDRKKPNGSLKFPHMKTRLVSYCGRYAWIKDTATFDLDNHIIRDEKPLMRNCVVTDDNMQEYVSEIISKYVPNFYPYPPWELRIITTESSSDDRFYVLARFHHLYTSEDDVRLGDLLMIASEKNDFDANEGTLIEDDDNVDAILADKRLRAVSILLRRVNDFLIECRNELLSTITSDSSSSMIIRLPEILVEYGLRIAFDFVRYRSLIVRAIVECIGVFGALYVTPKLILDEIILRIFDRPRHTFELMATCGRKIVRWTESIPLETIRSIKERTGTTAREIELYGVAAGLSEYFDRLKSIHNNSNSNNNNNNNTSIMTTIRFVTEEEILKKSSSKLSNGFLCLALPMKISSTVRNSSLYDLYLVRSTLQRSLNDRTILYLASLWRYSVLTTILPSFAVSVILNVLSKRYPITITQIQTRNRESRKRKLIWGQDIETFIYWRPTQANISMSISLISYANELRLSIMTDAQLAPHHNIIVSQFAAIIRELAKECADKKMTECVDLPEYWKINAVKKQNR